MTIPDPHVLTTIDGTLLDDLLRAPIEWLLATVDRDGVVTGANEALLATVGQSLATAVGRPLGDLHHGRDRDPTRAGDPDTLGAESGGRQASERRLRGGWGQAIPVRRWAIAQRDGGWLVVMRDLSEVARGRREIDARTRLAAMAEVATAEDVAALVACEAAGVVDAVAAGVMAWDADGASGAWGDAGVLRCVAEDACQDIHDGRATSVRPGSAPDTPGVVVAVAAYRGSRPWGALWVLLPSCPADLGDRTITLSRIASIAAPAIGAARARDRARTSPVVQAVGGPADDEVAIGRVLDAAERGIGAHRATCFVLDEQGAVAEVHTTETDPERGHRVRAAIARHGADFAAALAHGVAGSQVVRVVLPGNRACPASERMAQESGAAMLAALRLDHPTRRGADGAPAPLGVLAVVLNEPRPFDEGQRAMLQALGEVAVGALTSAYTSTSAADSAGAARDPLTGLPSHRAFQERLRAAVDRAKAGGPLSLVLLDIDRFRRINDEHGHLAGDRVLQEVARRTCAAAGPRDVVARIGGEEIGWLMPVSAMAALQAAERVREAIAAAPMREVGTVTVSAGVCDLSRARGDADRMVRLAEGALYWAKQHGRNVACLYSSDEVEVLSAHERAERLARSQALQSIRVLARAVDAKDPSTRRHSERVADLAVALARSMGWGDTDLVLLREAGLVHDVGKIGVPDVILSKPGRLTAEEYMTITGHAALGAEIVADVLSPEQVSWVRGHHERWDGKGYPDRLAATDIAAGARVLAVADAWDVMTSERPYRQSMAVDEAIAECLRCRGTQFDPDVVDALIALVNAGALVGAAIAPGSGVAAR